MSISTIEERWGVLLYRHCRSLFREVFLPSHNHHHHFRVWYYAKELIQELSDYGIPFPDALIEEIMLAVFFHDVGMSVTMGENHGKISADLFQAFMTEMRIQTDANREAIYLAIHEHDRKHYDEVPFEVAVERENILPAILNISDDLDAFGYTGVYRYLEIYLLREVHPDLLAERISENLTRRFSNISFTMGKIARFVEKHKARYQHTIGFFEALSETGYLPGKGLSGPSGVVNLVRDLVIGQQNDLIEIIESQKIPKHDEYIQEFLQHYMAEANRFAPLYPDL